MDSVFTLDKNGILIYLRIKYPFLRQAFIFIENNCAFIVSLLPYSACCTQLSFRTTKLKQFFTQATRIRVSREVGLCVLQMNLLNPNQKKCMGLQLQYSALIGELIMLLDIKKYLHHVENFDLSRAQKEELIRTVWGIMESGADKTFGQHPVQQCRKSVSYNSLQSPVKRIDSKKASVISLFKNTAENVEKGSEDYGR